MVNIPATVKITDFTVTTSTDPATIFECVQTVSGVGNSYKIALSTLLSSASLLPGPYQTSTFTQFGVLYGNAGSVIGVTAQGATGLPFMGQGAAAPTFSVVSLVGGGFGTTTLTNHGLVIGAGTNVPSISAVGTNGQLVIGQTGADPTWNTVGGDITLTSGGNATVAANAISYAKFTQVGPGQVVANPTNATANAIGTSAPILGVALGATGQLVLAGYTSGQVILQPGAGAAGTPTFCLPTSMGTAGQALVAGGNSTTAMTWTSHVTSLGWGLASSNVTAMAASLATVNPAIGYGPAVNLGIAASTAAGVLTVSIVSNLGTAPSATSPVLVPFHGTAIGTGVPQFAALNSTTQVTTVIGAGLGQVTSVASRFWIVLFYNNATTAIPALINCVSTNAANIFPLSENIVTSTIGMTATSNVAGTFYANTTATNMPYRIVGYLEWSSGNVTPGTYSALPTTIMPFGPGIKRPGEPVQIVAPVYGSLTVTTVTTALTSTLITASITPSSAANPVKFAASYSVTTSTGTAIITSQVYRATVSSGMSARTVGTTAMHFVQGIDFPGTTSATTYVVRSAVAAGTATIPAVNTDSASLVLWELMG